MKNLVDATLIAGVEYNAGDVVLLNGSHSATVVRVGLKSNTSLPSIAVDSAKLGCFTLWFNGKEWHSAEESNSWSVEKM